MSGSQTGNKDQADQDQLLAALQKSQGPQSWSPPGNWQDPTSQSNDFWTNLGQAMGWKQYPQGASNQQALSAAGWTPDPQQQQPVTVDTLQTLLQQRQGGVAGGAQGLQGTSLEQLAQMLQQRKQGGIIPTGDQNTGLLAGGLASVNR